MKYTFAKSYDGADTFRYTARDERQRYVECEVRIFLTLAPPLFAGIGAAATGTEGREVALLPVATVEYLSDSAALHLTIEASRGELGVD